MRRPVLLVTVLQAAAMAVFGLLFWATPPQTQTFPLYNVPGSYGPNKLRNSSLVSWSNGLGINVGAGWCGDGVYMVATGASANINRTVNDLASPYNNSVYACVVTGAASITDVTVRWIIESYDAATLAGFPITCQFPILNNTGGTITPTLTVYSGGSRDNWSVPNTDVSAVTLQAITSGSTVLLTYTWAASMTTANGLSIDIDFGNSFSTNGKNIHIGGGFNCRPTPLFPTGTGAASYPQQPDIPNAASDVNWNRRFFVASTPNAILPGAGTAESMVSCKYFASGIANYDGCSISFGTVMRATPVFSYWDENGNATAVSALSGTVWTNGYVMGGTPVISTTGALLPFTSGGPGADQLYFQYQADATLKGN